MARCVDFWADFSVVGSANSITLTITQSSTLIAYQIVAFEFTCPSGTCSLDTAGTDGFTNTGTSHFMSPVGELDTTANVTLIGACASTTNFGTRTQTTGFETDLTNLATNSFWQYEDDIDTAFTDERQAWSSTTSVGSALCRGWALKNTASASGASAPLLLLLGGQ